MQKISYRIPWKKEHNQNRFHSASCLVGHLELFEVGWSYRIPTISLVQLVTKAKPGFPLRCCIAIYLITRGKNFSG